jgi:hypothetical protein
MIYAENGFKSDMLPLSLMDTRPDQYDLRDFPKGVCTPLDSDAFWILLGANSEEEYDYDSSR